MLESKIFLKYCCIDEYHNSFHFDVISQWTSILNFSKEHLSLFYPLLVISDTILINKNPLFIVDFQDRRERINESVSNEVQSIFKGKTTNQLLLLEEQIRQKLQGGEGVDVGM